MCWDLFLKLFSLFYINLCDFLLIFQATGDYSGHDLWSVRASPSLNWFWFFFMSCDQMMAFGHDLLGYAQVSGQQSPVRALFPSWSVRSLRSLLIKFFLYYVRSEQAPPSYLMSRCASLATHRFTALRAGVVRPGHIVVRPVQSILMSGRDIRPSLLIPQDKELVSLPASFFGWSLHDSSLSPRRIFPVSFLDWSYTPRIWVWLILRPTHIILVLTNIV